MPVKHILLISSGQPSLNPRLVKEADAFVGAGFKVTVLYAYWNDWGTAFDKGLIASKKWNAVCVGGEPAHRPLVYFFSRLIYTFAKTISRRSSGKAMTNYAVGRSSFHLIKQAKKIKADVYIGHNLGALPATVIAAKINKKPCGFDAEDFHRNEMTDDALATEVILKSSIEDKYMPQLDYLTASSPLIAAAYHQLYPQVKQEVILNAFSKNSGAAYTAHAAATVKLFWFSQTVGLNRGLEDVVKALQLLNDGAFELHLLGKASGQIRKELGATSVYFHEPVAPDEVTRFASQFDIGLALEKSVPYNRDICLTNKLFTYAQAGLAVIASDTSAQKAFINTHAIQGRLYKNGDIAGLADALKYYSGNNDVLNRHREANYQLGQTTLNWETESPKLISLVNKTLNGQ